MNKLIYLTVSLILSGSLLIHSALAYNTVIIATIPVQASTQSDLEANPVTMTVYVTNSITNDISVIDAITNNVIATIPVETNPVAVSVNSETNKIYVANQDSNSVSVIDGNTNDIVATVNNIPAPVGIAINNVTNKVYVTNLIDNTVQVIDGSSDTIIKSINVGSNPFGVAVNIALNKIYVANSADASVSVIDGNTDTIIKTIGGSDIKSPLGIVANPVTNMVYMTNFQYGDGFITIINGTDDTTEGKIQTDIDSQPYYVALDAGKELLYVTHQVGGMLTVIDLATNNITQTIPTPASPVGVDVIPSLSRVYVAETNASIVTVAETT